MPYSFNVCFLACLGLLFSICQPKDLLAQSVTSPDYNLAISFELSKNRVIGTAQITIPAKSSVSFSLSQLMVTGAFVRAEDGTERELHPGNELITFAPSPLKRTLFISYVREVKNGHSNLISSKGISLTSNWYPYPSEPYIYSLSASLPDDFTAITQADTFPLAINNGITRSHWSVATRDIHFNAGPYVVNKFKVRDNLYVYSMFFAEDKELAAEYLKAAADYLRTYEKEIAPFPYNHYAIVANRLPTGYGIPTFTLLGQMVLRLPFIKTSSLGHEIVHSWFGNDVEVDYEGGNWCEALTSFLADHAFRQAEGKGPEDRKESLIKYHSYVHSNDSNPFTLRDFKSASHNQPMADFKRAVGYNGGAFLFHELREYIGKATFTRGIQDFYLKNSGKAASWKDLQTSFETASGKDLQAFFTTRLNMQEAPALTAEKISVDSRSGIHLNFTLTQQTEEPVPMIVPIQVTTMSGRHMFFHKLASSSEKVSLPLPNQPLEFTLDPEYTLLRKLAHDEKIPVWSRFLGAEKMLVVLADEESREKYQSILESLQKYQPTIVTAAEVTNKELSENNLLFLGADQAPCRSIFGKVSHNDNSVTVDVRNNPLHPDYVAVIISDKAQQSSPSIARRLTHYGKYSYLEFTGEGSVIKDITESKNGISYQLERLPMGGSTAALDDFSTIIDELMSKRVIYLGETHNSLPDHLLQLRVIEAIYQKDPNLAIGMEMFPKSSQASLDEYTRDDSTMDEKTFLKQSDYFNVWRYDYRLFRDIMGFAKSRHLQVRGLNLDRQIVSDVYRSGNTDALSDEIKASLPADRDLDLPGYQERLMSVHNVHVSGSHGQGASSGFIQSQGLWDETMAANIVSFLKNNPDTRLVVIAGNQHTRKDSGIPPRVAARIPVEQASLINIYEDSLPPNLSVTTDYFFLADQSRLPETPKIGVVLRPATVDDKLQGLVIDQLSPHGKAGEAGLVAGDIIIRLGATQITDMADLRIAMLDSREGDIIEVEVLRGKDTKKNHIINVELTIPQMPKGHP
ncbi:MAG: aminopeptidase N [Desulforhopalus sp.]|jgi:aminopeptidase N